MSSSFTNQNKLDFRQYNTENNGEKIRFHSYYQWVQFMLFFQAITFYVPHWIWKMWEGGKICMITKDMRGFCMDTAEGRQAKQNKLVCLLNIHFKFKGYIELCFSNISKDFLRIP